MKKVLILGLLIFVALIGNSQDRTGTITTGRTMLDQKIALGPDTIETSETYYIEIRSDQLYPQKQNMYASLTTISGVPSVAIKLYGKCFSGDTYVQIGSTITWASSSDNPVNISATTPNQYRYYKAEFVCSGTTQKVKLTAFELKLWLTSGLYSSGTLTDGTMTANSGALAGVTTIAASGRITGTGGATITGAATNINASSNFSTNIGTGSTDAAVTIGNALNTVAINAPITNTSAVLTQKYDAAAYWTATVANAGAVTFDDVSDGTAGFLFSDPVTFGSVVSAGILGGAGTATNATQTLGAAGGKAFSFYLSSTSATASDVVTGFYMNTNYGATGGAGAAPSGDVIRGRAYLMGDASGGTALTGGAFSVELEAATASNTGLTAGLRGNLVLPAGVLTNSGTYYGTMAEIYLGGASTDTRAYTTISPLGIVISGTSATSADQLSNMVAMDISVPANMVTADGTMVVTGATGAVAGGLKIRINGTDWWIMLASADQ